MFLETRSKSCMHGRSRGLGCLMLRHHVLLTLLIGLQQCCHDARVLHLLQPLRDPLSAVEQLTDCLYNRNDVSCIDTYCQPSVVVHGDGVWLPATDFTGATWAKNIHQDWFTEYSHWDFRFLDVAATPAVKGFSEVLGFFKWHANNTGSYHGLNPSFQVSHDYGLLHATVDKKGLVTDVSIWRAGFAEERQGLLLEPGYTDLISPDHDITDQPFWIPSKSLQLVMNTRAHALVELLNQGEKFLDSLDDMCIENVVLLDGMYIWGPPKVQGLPALKLWMAGWMQNYQVNAAVTASAATSNSDKVFLCFRMILSDLPTPGAGAAAEAARAAAGGLGMQQGQRLRQLQQQQEQGQQQQQQHEQRQQSRSNAQFRAESLQGCLVYVFNIQGFITHMVMYRSGTAAEMDAKLIGRKTWQQGQQQQQQDPGGATGWPFGSGGLLQQQQEPPPQQQEPQPQQQEPQPQQQQQQLWWPGPSTQQSQGAR